MTSQSERRPGPAPTFPPIHLAIRALLELAILVGYGIWGWHVGDGGVSGVLLAAVFIVIPAALWGTVRTPGETGAGGAVMPVPGSVRLLLEAVIIGACVYGVWTSWSRAAAETLLTALGLSYAITWERIRWLRRAPGAPR